MMYNVNEINLTSILGTPTIHKRQQGKRAGNDKRKYINTISAFDIETTRIPTIDNSVMYIWQWHFRNLDKEDDGITIYGRTWQEYLSTCEEIKTWINSNFDTKAEPIFMVRLVHNLSYEFQFLSGIYPYTENEVFAMEKRKVARADSFGCIEDRCTYIHSNLSLRKYAKNWNAKHLKESGIEFDYEKPRYSWTPMTTKELEYCENDVLSVTDAYINEMNHYHDTLYSIPLLPRDM